MADPWAEAWRTYERANRRARHAYRTAPLAAWADDRGHCPVCGRPTDDPDHNATCTTEEPTP